MHVVVAVSAQGNQVVGSRGSTVPTVLDVVQGEVAVSSAVLTHLVPGKNVVLDGARDSTPTRSDSPAILPTALFSPTIPLHGLPP